MTSEAKKSLELLEIIEKDRVQTTAALGREILQKTNAPLALIRGRAQKLHEQLEHYQKENAEGILEHIHQLEVLLNSVAKYALSAETKSKRSKPCELIDSLEEFYQIRLSQKNIHVFNLIPDDLNIEADLSDLRKILSCLFLNAIEALEDCQKENKCIFVQYQKTEKHYILSVEDNGMGIQASSFPSLFKPFFTTKKDHSGLSLAICWKVAERLGWKLKVVNREKLGARAEIWIPTQAE